MPSWANCSAPWRSNEERGNGETPGGNFLKTALALCAVQVHEVCHAANFRPRTLKNFENMNIFMFVTMFSDIFVLILSGAPA